MAKAKRNSLLSAAPTTSLPLRGLAWAGRSRLCLAQALKSKVNRSIGITDVHAQYLNTGRPCLLIGVCDPLLPADSDSVGLLPAIFIICFALRYDLKQPSSASNPATAIWLSPLIERRYLPSSVSSTRLTSVFFLIQICR